MSENPPPAPETNPYAASFRAMRRRRSALKILRRLGCGLLLVLWLGVMALPCAFVTLLVEKEIVLTRSSLPEHQTRIFFLDAEDERGFGLSHTTVKSGGADAGQVCLLTRVDYLMWAGEGKPVRYCDCYEKIDETWQATLIGGTRDCQTPE